jgi:uridine kinase
MVSTKVAIAGISSEVGKTTLLCQLLQEFRGWEAIKITRGHYRSCGKDPHNLPAYTTSDFPRLVAHVNTIHSARTREGRNQGN